MAVAAGGLEWPVTIVHRPIHCVQELVFENCVIGSSSVKDFTVWNGSEVPLKYRMMVLQKGATQRDRRGEIEFINADSGMPLSEASEVVLGYSHARIRVYFKPRDVGQYSMELEVSNQNDLRNFETIGLHLVVAAQPQHEGLLVSGHGVLDFGDCYSSIPSRKLLTVRNISEETLDVHFSSDLPDEVSFDLHTEYRSSRDTENVALAHKKRNDKLRGVSGGPVDDDGHETASSLSIEDPTHRSLRDDAGEGPLTDHENEHGGGEQGGHANSSRMRRIEEISIAPGRERAVYVCYCPAATTKDPLQAARLTRRLFRIDLSAHSSKWQRELHARCVQCRARVCTSLLEVKPTVYNLGDCDIQTHKVATSVVRNLSDLPAIIRISMKSKAPARLHHPVHRVFDTYGFVDLDADVYCGGPLHLLYLRHPHASSTASTSTVSAPPLPPPRLCLCHFHLRLVHVVPSYLSPADPAPPPPPHTPSPPPTAARFATCRL